jgi:hypothetical protein
LGNVGKVKGIRRQWRGKVKRDGSKTWTCSRPFSTRIAAQRWADLQIAKLTLNPVVHAVIEVRECGPYEYESDKRPYR